MLAAAAGLLTGGCASSPRIEREGGVTRLSALGRQEAAQITTALMTMHPACDPAEARRLADTAVRAGGELAEKYRVSLPAPEHNLLINMGLRERGLCWQWTWDLSGALAPLRVQTFDLHWGVSNFDRFNEHNSVVVTPRGRPFAEGILLDPWRLGGQISFFAVTKDPEYKWIERSPPAGAPRLARP